MLGWKVSWIITEMEVIRGIECGVQQGSCLGPLLYSIFTNDLYLLLRSAKLTMYADDTTVYASAQTSVELNESESIEKWIFGE